jgi:hypothetical protein
MISYLFQNTIEKRRSFVGDFKFVGTDEYIQIIFTGFETDASTFIFVGWVWEPTNVLLIRVDCCHPHMFVR